MSEHLTDRVSDQAGSKSGGAAGVPGGPVRQRPGRGLVAGVAGAVVVVVFVVAGVVLIIVGRNSESRAAARPTSAPSAAVSAAASAAAGPVAPAGPTAVTAPKGQSVPGQSVAAAVVPAALVPTSVKIPAIGVSSSLVKLGIAKDGTVQVPSSYQRAGWLDTGPAPGQQGPAVILGHVDSTAGPGIFDRLGQLKAGDSIQVALAGGKTVTFTVDGSEQVPKDHFPTADVYGPVPGPVLRLITCGGSFDQQTGHYRDNVVVFASEHA